ncbi:MAG: hypothetical protein JST30_03375 [Armatimonadetes bacterium]|nr:hypothetical protein [Armatimonadota bacterium]
MRVDMLPVVINGAHGEGGGALLRTALAMSALTQQSLRVNNVRGAMRRKGLNPEDLTFLQVLSASCGADATGHELDVTTLVFEPRHAPRKVDASFDVSSHVEGTVPGSAIVIAESLLPVLSRSGAYSRLTLSGESHGSGTLGYDAWERATLAVHREQGVAVFPSLDRAGFGYGSRGQVTVEFEPSVPSALEWPERGELRSLRAVLTLADVSPDVGTRGAKRLSQIFSERGHEIDVTVSEVRSRTPGVSVTLWAEFERGRGSGTALGQRGLRMELVVDQAVRNFDEWFKSPATVDSFLADQILPIAALSEGKTVYTTPVVTRRLVTMAWVIKQFMPVHITVKGEEGYPGTVTVER